MKPAAALARKEDGDTHIVVWELVMPKKVCTLIEIATMAWTVTEELAVAGEFARVNPL